MDHTLTHIKSMVYTCARIYQFIFRYTTQVFGWGNQYLCVYAVRFIPIHMRRCLKREKSVKRQRYPSKKRFTFIDILDILINLIILVRVIIWKVWNSAISNPKNIPDVDQRQHIDHAKLLCYCKRWIRHFFLNGSSSLKEK